MWPVVQWLCFIFIVLWVLIFIGGLVHRIERLFKRDQFTSVDESIKLMYVDQRPDPTIPDYVATRNAEQKRGR